MSKKRDKSVAVCPVQKEYSRFWATLAYPESSSIRLICERLIVSGVKAVVSPLHDIDLKDDIEFEGSVDSDGTVKPDVFKKPHYHILLCFESRKSRGQLESYFRDLDTVGLECVFDSSLYFHYLTHDYEVTSNKPKYDKAKLRFVNSTELDFLQADYLLADIIEMILEEKIYSLSYLFYHLKLLNARSEFDKYLSVIRKNSYLINCLIKENYNHYYSKGNKSIFDNQF